MGSRMAKRLLDAGHNLTVYNRTHERTLVFKELGAKVATTPRSATLDAEFIFSMVTDNDAARDVWFRGPNSAIEGLKSGQIVLECSTVSPVWIKELSSSVEKLGSEFIECPVAGSRPQAEAGKLICFLGGKASVADKVAHVLEPLSEATHLVGDVGSACVFKLLANGYFLSQIAALKEVMDVAKRSGLSLRQVNEVFQTLPATSPALKGVLQLVAAGNTDPRFTVTLVEKDLRYLIAQSTKQQGLHRVFEQTHEYFKKAIQEGKGEKNASVIVNDE